MPSISQKQHDLFKLAVKSPDFAKRAGIDPKVAQEFINADAKAGLWQSPPTPPTSPTQRPGRTNHDQ